MPIIRGSHSGTGQLTALARTMPELAPGAMPSYSVEIVNDSYGYLTIDPCNVPANALLPDTDSLGVINLLKQLGAAMIDGSPTAETNSTIPPVYTYWGQFIDHDITAGTDGSTPSANPASGEAGYLSVNVLKDAFEPVPPAKVVGQGGIQNLRMPQLDLDSIYGDGPDDETTWQAKIYCGTDRRKLRLGRINFLVNQAHHLPDPIAKRCDLPRTNRRADIADDRNDENLILAQLHVAFLHFHNAVLHGYGQAATFEDVSDTVRMHYQWLVVNDYLRTICQDGIVDEVLQSDALFFTGPQDRYIPLEFATAAFRFGHSMVRPFYDYNANFGREASPPHTMATLDDLFTFTGLKGCLNRGTTIPSKWIIDWSRFTDKQSQYAWRFARKIDTNLAAPLATFPPDLSKTCEKIVSTGVSMKLQQHLAQRNLLRGYLLSIPTGQHVADWFGVPRLTPAELVPSDNPLIGPVLQADDGLLLSHTPLWYYILREAAVHSDGNALGEVGSRLVAGTLIGLLKSDRCSYLCRGWEPSQGIRIEGKPLAHIMDLFRYACVA